MNKTIKQTFKDILSGIASSAKVLKTYGEDSLPDVVLDIDGPLETILPSRKKFIAGLYRWLLPALIDVKNDFNPNYKLAVVTKRGHGASTMADALMGVLINAIGKHVSIGPKIAIVKGNSAGVFTGTANPGATSTIVILDGIPNKDKMEPKYIEMLKRSTIIAFVTDNTELSQFTNEEIMTIKMDPLTNQEVKDIAKLRKYTDGDKENTDKLCEQIDGMLTKDIAPKAVLDYISVASGVSYAKFSSPTRTSIPYEMLDIITNSHTELKMFDQIPMKELRSFISQEVFGQEDAINILVETIGMMQYGLVDPSRPVLSTLFVGPTGVGKTLMAEVLSKALFGRQDIVRIDMSEYADSFSTNKLFGADPGFVGYDTDSVLVRELKRRNKGVLLFDEIEKAHTSVHHGLLQLLDAGKFTSGKGEVIDATGYIVIMTSNALSEKTQKELTLGFGSKNEYKGMTSNAIRKALVDQKTFSPEFINRIDSIVGFKVLSDEIAMDICNLMIKEVKDIITSGYNVTYTKKYIEEMITHREPLFGGRSIRRLVDASKRHIVRSIEKDPDNMNIKLDLTNEIENTRDW